MTVSKVDWLVLAEQMDAEISQVDIDALKKMSEEERGATAFAKMTEQVKKAMMRARADEVVRAHMIGTTELVLSSEDDVLNRPSPEWIVEGLVQENTLCLFAGPGGIGKTFFSLALSRSVASGGMFFGKQVKRGRVLYVVAEGAAAFGDRVRAWDASNFAVVPGDAITYVEAGVNLSDAESVGRLAQVVADGDYSLVILDTLSQLAHFENENNNAEIARVFLQIKRLRDAREGTSVLIVDHTPAQGGKARGGTAKRDNSDTAIVAARESEGFTVSTRSEDGGKQKDGEEFAWVGFSLQSVGNSAVLTNSGKRPTSPNWPIVAAVLIDGEEHKAAELRDACGVDGDARSAGAKALGREIDKWIADGLVERHGKTANTTYKMTAAAMAVIDR